MGLRIKGIFVLAVLVASIALILPTFQAYSPGGNPQAIKNKVNLGLDLQGGMYLDVEVDSRAAVTRVLDRIAVEIEDLLLENLIDYNLVERRGDQVEVELSPGEKVEWNQPPFERLLRDVIVDPVGENAFRMSLPGEETDRILKGSVSQALEVIRNRIDSLGVNEPSIQRHGEESLLIQLPGLKDRESAIRAIGTQAVLEFYLVEDNVTPTTMNPGRHTIKYEEVRDPTTKKLLNREPYVVGKRPVLAGDTVQDARVAISNQDNTPYVSISFNSLGSDRFAKITTRNRGRRLAIVLDDKVQSAPVIREAITGGEAQISGRFTMDEATDLAIVLRSGSLPAPISIREERTVGATLGEDSIRQGLASLGGGDSGGAVHAFLLPHTGDVRGAGAGFQSVVDPGGAGGLPGNAHPAGHRGYRAHDGDGRGRQRAHFRAHPGGTAPQLERSLGHSGGISEGGVDHFRRQCDHPGGRVRAARVRHGAHQGFRGDPQCGNPGQHVHGARGDPAAVRPVLSEPAPAGALPHLTRLRPPGNS